MNEKYSTPPPSTRSVKFLKRLISFKSYNFLYLLIPLLLLLIVIFQNCKIDSPLTSSSDPSPDIQDPSPDMRSQDQPPPEDSERQPSASTSSILYNTGSLVAYLSAEDESKAKSQFAVDSKITLNFVSYHPDSDKFKWTISKAFDVVVGDQQTAEGQYLFTPSSPGVYDISATTYQSELQTTYASKRLIIGDSCKPSSFPEITLKEGFLTVGQTAAFSLRDASLFSSIVWNVTLKSGKLIESSTQDVVVDLTDETDGPIVLEVSAVDSSGCLTYRKKTYYVAGELLRPHFNPVSLIDSSGTDITLELENNDIYRYARPSSDTVYSLLLNVKNADVCELDGASLSCSDGKTDFTFSTDNECEEHIVTLSASYQNTKEVQEYYNYCPQGGTYCYFGSLNNKPDHYICPVSTRLPSSLLDKDHVVRSDLSNDVGECCDSPSERNCCKEEGAHLERPSSQYLYRWQCIGRRQDSPICTSNRPINGKCGSSYNGHCRDGSREDLEDDKIHFKWRCLGRYGGDDSRTCYKRRPGVCDDGNKYQCVSGIVINRGQDDNEYEWKCSGDPDSRKCESPRDFPGDCSGRRYRCDRGAASQQSGNKTHYTWKCSGVQGGSSASCETLRPGVCDYSQGEPSDACQYGTFSNTRDSDEHYKWKCYGDPTRECKQSKGPEHGVCNNSFRNGCSSGTPRAIADTNTHYRWYCQGRRGGRTVYNCTKAKPPAPVHGQCRSDHYNCRLGAPSNQREEETRWTWQCRGSNGGRTVNCSENRSSSVCPSNKRLPHYKAVGNQCLPSCGAAGGNASSSSACNDTQNYNIRRITQRVYDTSVCCHRTPKTTKHGVCNNAVKYGCISTAAATNRTASGGYDRWHCPGSGNPVGRTATNCLKREQGSRVDGVCNNNQTYSCNTGDRDSRAISDTDTYYRWYCRGRNGGRTATNCKRPKHAVGDCSGSLNRCDRGVFQDVSDSQTHHKWECVGFARTVPCERGRDGRCDYSQGEPSNSCTYGTFRDTRDSDEHYKWKCIGAGPDDDADCKQRKVCTDTGSYSNQSVCQRGLPSNQECYRSGRCWRRRTSTPTCNPPHSVLRGGRCVPSCGAAVNKNNGTANGYSVARGSNCGDTANYHIRGPWDTYESSACCTRKRKSSGGSTNVCPSNKRPPHYKAVGNRCLPSCGAARGNASGGRCNDHANYDIRIIPDVYDVSVCCKRTPK